MFYIIFVLYFFLSDVTTQTFIRIASMSKLILSIYASMRQKSIELKKIPKEITVANLTIKKILHEHKLKRHSSFDGNFVSSS